MPETTKVGVEISEKVWKQFREDVKNRRGRVRGVLGNEVEKALQKQMMATEGGDAIDHMKRIEDKLDTVIEAEADGSGATVVEPSSAPAPDSKPKPNATRHEKVRYLIDEMGLKPEGGSIHRDGVRNVIQEEYDFTDDTIDDYIQAIATRLDAVPDPEIDGMLIWGDEEDERYAEVNANAAEEMEQISSA